ncbi:hypothetical protein ACOZDF_34600 [Streptomyces griseoincarnatus]
MTRIEWRPIKTTTLIPGSRPSRLPIAVTAVVVLLIAAIALAMRGDESGAQTPAATDTVPTAPEQPTRSRQGAESAATRLAAAFGSEAMFREHDRRELIESSADPAQREQMLADATADYDRLAQQIGLEEQGQPPAGAKFISRTTPVKTTMRRYEGNTAVVDVWCSAVFGLTGEGVKEIPPSTSWLTMALTLRWHQDDGWKLVDLQQSEGPKPVR